MNTTIDTINNFKGSYWVESTRKWPLLPWFVAVAYVVAVLRLDAILGTCNSKPQKLTSLLIVWNAALAALSTVGALVTLPHLLFNEESGVFVTGNFVMSVCAPADHYRDGKVGLTMALFVYSKYVELFDTLFLVLRRKKLSVLHVFHHAATLILCQRLYINEGSTGLVFGSMNLFVHAVMYTYYLLTQFESVRPVLIAHGHIVTQMQLLQMVLGAMTNVLIVVSIVAGNIKTCAVDVGSVAMALILYSTYLWLFAVFYVNRKSGISSSVSYAKKQD